MLRSKQIFCISIRHQTAPHFIPLRSLFRGRKVYFDFSSVRIGDSLNFSYLFDLRECANRIDGGALCTGSGTESRLETITGSRYDV